MLRRPANLLLLTALMCISGWLYAAGDKSSEIKAAYLYNFARFVEWPAVQFALPQTPLVLCTTELHALDGHLLRIHGRQAQGRALIVQLVAAGDDISHCQILFLPAQENPDINVWLQTAAGKSILTISDAPDFVAQGGMIGLFVEADRIQFAINREPARLAGLHLGSKLLALARTPRRGAR